MNMKSVNIVFQITIVILISLIVAYATAQTQVPLWPVNPQNDPNDWNQLNGTFGEIHGGGTQFHGAIDIDVNQPNCPARLVQAGIIYHKGKLNNLQPGNLRNGYLAVKHEYPPGTGLYSRRTRYLHLNYPLISSFQINTSICFPVCGHRVE